MNELLARADGGTIFILICVLCWTLYNIVERIANAFKRPEIHNHYECKCDQQKQL